MVGQAVKTYQKDYKDMTEEELGDCPCDMSGFDSFVEYGLKDI